MRDLDFIDSISPRLRLVLSDGSIVSRFFLIVFLPFYVVTYSRTTLGVKIILELLSVIVFIPYISFLIFVVPFLLFGSMILEFEYQRSRDILRLLFYFSLFAFIITLTDLLGLFYFINSAQSLFSSLPYELDVF